MEKCKCGKPAEWYILVDTNAYDAKKQPIKEENYLCNYHAEKSKELGYTLHTLKDIYCLGCGEYHSYNMTTRKVECQKEEEYLEQHLIAEDEEGNTTILD